MENTTLIENASKGDAEYEATIDALIAEMRRIREQMADDQREIETLRAETRVIMSQLKSS
jgi:hypothetical protein